MLLGLYQTDTADTLDRARLAPAAELPPAFSETYHAAFAESRAFGNSDALWRSRHEAVQASLDAFENATGEALSNPEAAPAGPNRDALERHNQARFDQVSTERPDLKLSYPTDEQRQQTAVEKAQQARGEVARLDARPGTFASGAGGIAGGIVGAMTDPLNIASMFMGAGAASGILRTALVEGGLAAGSQAVIEAGTAPFKQQVDPKWGVGDAVESVAMAGAGGAIIGGGVKGIGGLIGKFRGRAPREVQDAANVLERDAEVRGSNPLGPTVAGEQAHVGAMQKAAQDMEAGRPVDVQPIVAEARAEAPSASLGIPSLRPANDVGGAPRASVPPPVQPGYVRFYHGGARGSADADGPRWLSPDMEYAENYARKSDGGKVYYVDIPADDSRLVKAFEDEGSTVKAPFVSFDAPPDIARRLTPVLSEGTLGDQGSRARVYTPSGRAVDVEYRVVEADTLTSSHGANGTVNPAFPADLQPRDRTRLASQTQIAEMAGQLQPERLGRSPDAATGAPIVGPDMVVESGNGRVGAIRSAYEQGGDAAARYREWVIGQDPAAEGMRNPVLVAVRKTEMDPAARAELARDANGATAARMSPTELALADARRLDDAALGRLTSGDVTAAGNRGFVRSFLDRLPASERGSLVDAGGALNQEGRKRIEGALLGKAYGDPAIIGRIVEDADSDIRAIGGALLDVAGPWSKLRAAVARGDLPAGMDVTSDLLSAVRMVAEARASGRAVSELAQQMGLFGDDLSVVGRQLLAGLFRDEALSKPAGRARVAEMLSGYLDEASKNSAGARLFGEPLTAEQIIRGERLTSEGAGQSAALPGARPAEEVAGAPETQDALFQEVNRVMAARDLDVPMGEAIDPETGKMVATKRSALDLMDDADRAINDAATIAACAFGMAAE